MRMTAAVPTSPHEAFAVLADFASLAAWDPFVREAVLIEGRPLEPGAVYAITAVGGMMLRYVVVSADPPSQITYQGGTRNVMSTDHLSVAPSADGSIVTVDSELEFRGWTRIIGWLVRLGVSAGGRFVSLPALRRYLAAS